MTLILSGQPASIDSVCFSRSSAETIYGRKADNEPCGNIFDRYCSVSLNVSAVTGSILGMSNAGASLRQLQPEGRLSSHTKGNSLASRAIKSRCMVRRVVSMPYSDCRRERISDEEILVFRGIIRRISQ